MHLDARLPGRLEDILVRGCGTDVEQGVIFAYDRFFGDGGGGWGWKVFGVPFGDMLVKVVEIFEVLVALPAVLVARLTVDRAEQVGVEMLSTKSAPRVRMGLFVVLVEFVFIPITPVTADFAAEVLQILMSFELRQRVECGHAHTTQENRPPDVARLIIRSGGLISWSAGCSGPEILPVLRKKVWVVVNQLDLHF